MEDFYLINLNCVHMMNEHPIASAPEFHDLQCMEIWSGNKSVESTARSSGLDVWIFSRPYLGESHGGDVHYLSLCVGGIVTRLVLADVSGHGHKVADTSLTLRKLLRRYMNAKKQDRLAADLNREFSNVEQNGRFATAVLMTYLSHQKRLLLTNAGHPRPLFFRKAIGHWQYLESDRNESDRADNLPLGIQDTTLYQTKELSIESDDLLILYTDALTEARDAGGKQLGEGGLLTLIESIPSSIPFDQFGRGLMSAVLAYSNGVSSDDETLMVIRFGHGRQPVGIIERLRGYAKVLRPDQP